MIPQLLQGFKILFKLYLVFFDEVLILKNYLRKACFDNDPRELSTF